MKMKELKRVSGCLIAVCVLWAGLLLTGCHSSEPQFMDFPATPGGTGKANTSAPTSAPGGTGKANTSAPTPAPVGTGKANTSAPTPAPVGIGKTNTPAYSGYVKSAKGTDAFQIGDVVTIMFNSGDQNGPQPHQEAIKDDGRITPPFIGSVVALGKSPGELQYELQTNYNKLYVNMTVTVTARDRYYYVSGEVKAPGAKTYLGETDIIRAISNAGDFTDFANKKKVRLIRSNGKTEIVNVIKAIEDPKYNVPVFPNDRIVVPRSIF
jgi:polysaccharide export outer membrane protein